MRQRLIPLMLIVIVAALIGCAGESDSGFGIGTASSSTNGSTNGSTTGATSGLQGSYDGAFNGSNTTGARFSGSGFADIDASGNAFFGFDASVGGAPYHREFTGTVNSSGAFSGFTHTGEATTGTASLRNGVLTAQLVWQKRTASGQIFYTETENFSLAKQ